MLNSRLIAMLIGLGILSACNDADDGRREAQNDNGTDVSLNIGGDKGGGSISGKFRIPSFKLGASDVDIDGVKLYPGARVTGVDLSGQEGESEGGMTLRFDADAGLDKVRDYYLAAFKEKGLIANAEGAGLSGRDKEGKPFRIDLSPQGSGTRGVIHLGSQAN